MSARGHLRAMHEKLGEHAASHADYHKVMEKCCSKLSECAKSTKSEMKDGDGNDVGGIAATMAAAHAVMGEECQKLAEFHSQCAGDLAETTSKAAGVASDEDRDLWARREAAETEVRKIIGPAPGHYAVPRHGSPMPAAPAVDPVFEKIFSVE